MALCKPSVMSGERFGYLEQNTSASGIASSRWERVEMANGGSNGGLFKTMSSTTFCLFGHRSWISRDRLFGVQEVPGSNPGGPTI